MRIPSVIRGPAFALTVGRPPEGPGSESRPQYRRRLHGLSRHQRCERRHASLAGQAKADLVRRSRNSRRAARGNGHDATDQGLYRRTDRSCRGWFAAQKPESRRIPNDHATAGVPQGHRRHRHRGTGLGGLLDRRAGAVRRSWSSAAGMAARRSPNRSNLWSNGALDITLVEADPAFVSCPMSNLVLGGSKQISDVTVSYEASRSLGSRCVDTAQAVDPVRGAVRSRTSATFPMIGWCCLLGWTSLWSGAGNGKRGCASEGAACVEGRSANRRVAPATGSNARRRRIRDLHSESALSMPARALRARLPGRVVFQARQTAQQSTGAGRQRGRHFEEGHCS